MLRYEDVTPGNIFNILTAASIRKAAGLLSQDLVRTPTVRSRWLSSLTKGDIHLKLENLQITGSFKPRGAFIKYQSLTEEEKKRGVITMSAGNHAQGVAYFAQKMGVPACIVMPESTPIIKVERTRQLGASVALHGKNMSEARDFALQVLKKRGYTLIHTFDDPYVIAGQGTVAVELLNDIPNLDVLVIPIGGGGLAAGMSIVAKEINPNIQIVGIQSAYCPALTESLFPNALPRNPRRHTQTIAEGISIKFPGILNQAILKETLDTMIVVEEETIETAVEGLMTEDKVIAEGAGAVGVAAILTRPDFFEGKKVGVVISGGNIDSRVLANLLLRGMVQQGRLVRFKIEINDTYGVLGQLCQIIGKTGGNIFEISHQRLFNSVGVKMAYVDAVIETRDNRHSLEIAENLVANGYPTEIVEG